jgi:hypothetical protein
LDFITTIVQYQYSFGDRRDADAIAYRGAISGRRRAMTAMGEDVR